MRRRQSLSQERRKLTAFALLTIGALITVSILLMNSNSNPIELTYISLTEEGLGQLTLGLPSESFKSIRQIDDMSSEYIDSILSGSDIDFFGEDIGYYIEQGSERVFISKDIVVFIRFGIGNNKSDEVQAALPANVRVKTLGDGAVTVMVASVSEGGTCKIDAIMKSLKYK